MSISSRITEMEQHIGNAYDKIEDLGIDLTNVDKNIDNISSMLENVWNEYPKVTATDVEEASINGTKKGRMEIDLKAQTSQEQLSGKNLLNGVNPTTTISANSSLSNNIITISSSAVNTLPYCSWEIPVSEGDIVRINGIIKNNNGRIVRQTYNGTSWGGYVERNYTDGTSISSLEYTAVSGIEKVRFNLYSNNSIPSGSVSSNYENVIVTKNNTDMTYEPYCGGISSPNPDFPQPIKNVKGNANVKIQNKNLFVPQKIVDDSDNQDVYLTEDGFIRFKTCGNRIILKPNIVKENTQYTFSLICKSGVTTTNNINFSAFYTDGTSGILSSNVRTNNQEFSVIFTTSNNKTLDYIRSGYTDEKEAFIKIDGSMILEGSYTSETIPSYVPHQEQNYPFTFAQSQRAMQGTTLEDDGFHQTWGEYIFTGNENWVDYQGTQTGDFYKFYTTGVKLGRTNNMEAKENAYCTHFINNRFYANDNGIGLTQNATYISIDKTIASTPNELKTFFATQYNNGNPVKVQYIRAIAIVISYQGVQQSQYNAIKQARSYDDQTNISSTSDELRFKMDVESLRKIDN